jgi:hypothetical protein
MRARAALIATTIGLLAVPTSAHAWKYVFPQPAVGGVSVVAKKCKGGKLGVYKATATSSPSAPVQLRITYDLPIRPKFKPIRNVQVTFTSDLPPETEAEFVRANTDFYSNTFTRFKKNKLISRHPAFVIFGQQTTPAGQSTSPFNPKKGC